MLCSCARNDLICIIAYSDTKVKMVHGSYLALLSVLELLVLHLNIKFCSTDLLSSPSCSSLGVTLAFVEDDTVMKLCILMKLTFLFIFQYNWQFSFFVLITAQ